MSCFVAPKSSRAVIFVLLLMLCCNTGLPHARPKDGRMRTGSERTEAYFPLILGKKIALVANHTSLIGKKHLADSLLGAGMDVVRIFSPEHGFRGEAEAGEKVSDNRDARTGLPVISLYGKNLHPGKEAMAGLEAVVFDLQDAGVRFYTYASTMQYMMDACAAAGIPFILLDRPSPNAYYIDGPVLEKKFASFVGLNPIPLVHGMTLGEYAMMINEEGWLARGRTCMLHVISVYNYNHSMQFQLTIPPSPNLPNMAAVYLYPSLGLFEGTAVSVGRGTSKPFQVIGYPGFKGSDYSFMPVSMPGFSINPPYRDMQCQGFDVSEFGMSFLKDTRKIYLFWLMEFYKTYPDQKKFFNPFFDKLAGTDKLRKQIQAGKSEEEIRNSWKPALSEFKKLRKKYLLYPDFE